MRLTLHGIRIGLNHRCTEHQNDNYYFRRKRDFDLPIIDSGLFLPPTTAKKIAHLHRHEAHIVRKEINFPKIHTSTAIKSATHVNLYNQSPISVLRTHRRIFHTEISAYVRVDFLGNGTRIV